MSRHILSTNIRLSTAHASVAGASINWDVRSKIDCASTRHSGWQRRPMNSTGKRSRACYLLINNLREILLSLHVVVVSAQKHVARSRALARSCGWTSISARKIRGLRFESPSSTRDAMNSLRERSARWNLPKIERTERTNFCKLDLFRFGVWSERHSRAREGINVGARSIDSREMHAWIIYEQKYDLVNIPLLCASWIFLPFFLSRRNCILPDAVSSRTSEISRIDTSLETLSGDISARQPRVEMLVLH